MKIGWIFLNKFKSKVADNLMSCHVYFEIFFHYHTSFVGYEENWEMRPSKHPLPTPAPQTDGTSLYFVQGTQPNTLLINIERNNFLSQLFGLIIIFSFLKKSNLSFKPLILFWNNNSQYQEFSMPLIYILNGKISDIILIWSNTNINNKQ